MGYGNDSCKIGPFTELIISTGTFASRENDIFGRGRIKGEFRISGYLLPLPSLIGVLRADHFSFEEVLSVNQALESLLFI
jgi:hypothetical protein